MRKITVIYGSTYKDLERENKHLNLQLDQALNDYEELLIKIEKAKEYIKDLYDVRFTDKDKRKLLDILGDKENE